MGDYDQYISRTDAAALVPTEASREILKEVVETGWIFKLAKKLPDMSTKQRRMPVANALATAYFVTGDIGLKKTSELDWTNKYIDAEELAVIVPIPEAVLDDSDYDIWGEVKPALVEAFNFAITQAVLYGTNIPSTWTTNLGAAGIVALATARGKVATISDFADLYEAVMGESSDGAADGLIALVENQGFPVTGHVAHMSMKARFRNARDNAGRPLFSPSAVAGAPGEIDGAPIYFPTDGSIDPTQALDICGDWSQLVYAMRQDITYTIAKEAVITDASGNVVYNLFQQDMVALRAVMRLGFALPNPLKRMTQDEATRCPFAILEASTS